MKFTEVTEKLRERNDDLSLEAANLIDDLVERYRNATRPLSKEEVDKLKNNGWEFANPYYIYIPDDYDGCFAEGLSNIRKILKRCS